MFKAVQIGFVTGLQIQVVRILLFLLHCTLCNEAFGNQYGKNVEKLLIRLYLIYYSRILVFEAYDLRKSIWQVSGFGAATLRTSLFTLCRPITGQFGCILSYTMQHLFQLLFCWPSLYRCHVLSLHQTHTTEHQQFLVEIQTGIFQLYQQWSLLLCPIIISNMPCKAILQRIIK